MENVKTVYQECVLEWMKIVAQKKYQSWVSSVSEFEQMTDSKQEHEMLKLHAQEQMEKSLAKVSKIRDRITECNSFDEINTFITSLAKENEKIQASLMNQIQNGNQPSSEVFDIASLTIEGDVIREMTGLRDTYLSIEKTLNKVGLETDVLDVDIEDIEYLFGQIIKDATLPVKTWIAKIPKIYDKIAEDLKTALSDDATIPERRDAVDAIEHFIEITSETEFAEIAGGDINEFELQNTNVNQSALMEKLNEFYQGSNNLLKLTNLAELTHIIYNEVEEAQKKGS